MSNPTRRGISPFLAFAIAGVLSAFFSACAPSLHDFHDQILEPLAVQKADEFAEQNRLQVRRAFEEAMRQARLPGERWFDFFYWGLDALGFAGYGMPGQGRVLEKLKDLYQRSANKSREAELHDLLVRIDEQRASNKKAILQDLIAHTSEKRALFAKIYSVCLDGVTRRYRGTGNGFSRLDDRPCE